MSRSKYQFFLAVALATIMAVAAQAQEETQDKKPDSAEEKQDEPRTLVEIRSEMMKAQSEFLKSYRAAAPGSAEQRQALEDYYGVADQYADQIIELVKEDPTDRVGVSLLSSLVNMTRKASVRKKAVAAMFAVAKADPKSDSSFQMLMMLSSSSISPMEKDEAQQLLMENFGDSEKMGEFAMTLTRAQPSEQTIEFLRALIKKSMLPSVKGPATYALGKMLQQNEETREEGIALIKSIPEDFKDVKVYGGRMNLADMVAGELFEIERLQIGMEVPDIEGEDVDGVEFKLSDYRGKVVVLDFWGDW